MAQPLHSPAWPRLGEAARRREGHVVSPSATDVQQHAGDAAVVWLAGVQSDASCQVVAEVIASAIDASVADIRVMRQFADHPAVVREVPHSSVSPPPKQTPAPSALVAGSAARDAEHTPMERGIGPMALMDTLDATTVLGHGRRLARQSTPPASPPLSPTSVLQALPRSKRGATATPVLDEVAIPALIHLCSPTTMLPPLISLSLVRPPGFEAFPTPTLNYSGELRRTPPPPRRAIDMEVAHGAEELLHGFEDLFLPGKEALLPAPASSPLPPPATRRKTLAGVAVCRTGGLSLRRTSARLRASGRAHKPAAAVEKADGVMVCRSIDIIEDGEDITEAALDKFAAKFKGQVPAKVQAAMRVLFKLDDPRANAIEDALINHGGEDALDHEASAVQSA